MLQLPIHDSKILRWYPPILAICDHKFGIVNERATLIVLHRLLSPLMARARVPDNRPHVPLRSLRFARFLSTGGDQPMSPPTPGRVVGGEEKQRKSRSTRSTEMGGVMSRKIVPYRKR